MKYKSFIFICLLICLFSIASVYANDLNETIAMSEDQTGELIEVKNLNTGETVETCENNNIETDSFNNSETHSMMAENLENNKFGNNNDILGIDESQGELILDNEYNNLYSSSNYPTYSDYSVRFSNNIIKTESDVTISMIISPASSHDYKYYYYLNIYDFSDNLVFSKLFYDTDMKNSESCTISANQLFSGNTFSMKIVNYYDNKVMNSAMLVVNFTKYYSPSSSDYSVSVNDVNIIYENGGYISMSINPFYSYKKYYYNYYMKVYDSNDNEKISEWYCSDKASYSKNYFISPSTLSPGTYTIKIINYKDNCLLSSAKLIVKFETHIYSEKVETTYGHSKNLIVTLKDSHDVLVGKLLSVTLNGKIYSGTTDSNGQIIIKIPADLSPKEYAASIKFAGDDKYECSSNYVQVVVSKIKTKITVKSVTGYQGKKVKLTAKITDDAGKNMNNGKVILKINGKTYSATVKNGIAVITIKYPKAHYYDENYKDKGKYRYETTYYKSTYTCTATYQATGNYQSSSSTFKVTSKAKPIKHKYRIYNYRTFTLPVKKTLKFYHKGVVILAVGMKSLTTKNKLIIGVGDRNDHPIKFKVKEHYKKNGKWKWKKWFKCDEDHYVETTYGKAIKIDKVKIRCYSPYFVKIY